MLFIDNSSQLLKIQSDIFNARKIGIDTEFMRTHTYYAKLSLLQIATANEIYVIDVVNVDISDLYNVFADNNIQKIFHASFQDIQILIRYFELQYGKKCVVKNVFDTQIAADYAGMNKYMSYKDLCKQLLGVDLDKQHQFAKWLHRPLSKDLIQYASYDVKYLIQLQHILEEQIIIHDRVLDFKMHMSNIEEHEFYDINLETIWTKMHHIPNRSKKMIEKLQMLAAFREEVAMRIDVPRQRVIDDANLVLIAQHLPTYKKKLEEINITKHRFSDADLQKLFTICSGLQDYVHGTKEG